MEAGSPKGVPVGPRELDQSYRESASLHAERREQRVDGAGQPFGTALPLGAERRARASEVRSGRLTLLGDVTQVQVRGIEELELAGGPIAGSQHVGERRTVLLGEAEQHVASLLDGAKALRVALDGGGVVLRGLGELRDVRERTVQELLPLGHRGIEPREASEQLGRAREAGGVERLLQLARQTAQLVGMGEALRFDLQRLYFAGLRGRALDFLDDVSQVVRLAAHLLASGRELLLATLELVQALVRIAHRRPLQRGV